MIKFYEILIKKVIENLKDKLTYYKKLEIGALYE